LDAAVADEEVDRGLRLEVGDAVADHDRGAAVLPEDTAEQVRLAAAARERARGVEARVAAGGVERDGNAVEALGRHAELRRERQERRAEPAADDVDHLAEAMQGGEDRNGVLGRVRRVELRDALELGARRSDELEPAA